MPIGIREPRGITSLAVKKMSPEIFATDVTQSTAERSIELPPIAKDPRDVSDAILDKFDAPSIRYKCRHSECDLSFKRKDQLHSHEYTHTGRKLFHCDEPDCPKSYTNNAHLQRHIRVVHQAQTKVELVPCKHGPPCSRSYKSKEKMLIHYQKVHIDRSDIKSLSFKCDLCAAVFRRKAQHRQHMFGHTNQYPYTCQHCQRGFMNRYNLVRHENSHRIYDCPDCEEKFLKWSLLVAHRHAGHVVSEVICTVCGRQFQSKRGLKHHRVVHDDRGSREILQCPHAMCPSYFFHQRNLNAHIRTKHEDVKFICDFGGCGKTLCSKQKLLLHMNVVHLKKKLTTKTRATTIDRKQRKDKGVPRESTAAKLAHIQVPKEIDRLVLAGKGHQIQFEYDGDQLPLLNGDRDGKVDDIEYAELTVTTLA